MTSRPQKLSRLLSVLHQAGTVTLDGAGYTYDNTGNRTSKTNYLNNITENYTYDPIYQLTQVTQGLTTTESYSYDAVGNRLSSLGVSPYVYNSSNQLTSTPAATFTYDNNGNSATKADVSGTTTYNWDFENRLTSVVLPGAGGTVTFKYDPFGRRIQKSSANGITNYVYDGSNSVQEVDQAGAELVHYAQGDGIDQPLVASRGGVLGFYEQDGLASVTTLTDSTGRVLDSYTYDSFGNAAPPTGSFINLYQFTGRDYDAETGLRYYRGRYYSPDTGRFISEDPVGFSSGTMNLYSYVGSNPGNFTDPTGYRRDCPVPRLCGDTPPSQPRSPLPPLPGVDPQIGAIQGLFPGSLRGPGPSLIIPLPCSKVREILHSQGFIGEEDWGLAYVNPFDTWDPIFHFGGVEYRTGGVGLHFRVKYSFKPCDKECTLDQFHIDRYNPLDHPWDHLVHDFLRIS
jgi:RHS repeat-associated protein